MPAIYSIARFINDTKYKNFKSFISSNFNILHESVNNHTTLGQQLFMKRSSSMLID